MGYENEVGDIIQRIDMSSKACKGSQLRSQASE